MRRRTHLVIGALAFTAYGWLLLRLLELSPGELLLGLFAALLGSVTPDVLEPARHGNHRGIAHSRWALRVSALAFVLTGILGILGPLVPALSPSYLLSAFLLGYALHLLADSLTPAGLPE